MPWLSGIIIAFVFGLMFAGIHVARVIEDDGYAWEKPYRGAGWWRPIVIGWVLGWVIILSPFIISDVEVAYKSVGKTEIESFYYHEENRYTAAVLNNGVFKTVDIPRAVIKFDAKNKAWYKCKFSVEQRWGETTGACYVHLRNIDDINTASWNHGKLGSGNTARIN